MTTALWIHGRDGLAVGDAGFLVRISNATNGSERYELRDRPPRTSQPLEPIPRGRCRTRNDTTTDGLGVWRVLKAARNGRVEVQEITDQDELMVFLAERGYRDLLKRCLSATVAA
jgi:hypothetical protein